METETSNGKVSKMFTDADVSEVSRLLTDAAKVILGKGFSSDDHKANASAQIARQLHLVKASLKNAPVAGVYKRTTKRTGPIEVSLGEPIA